MNANLKSKLLLNLAKNKKDKGFTLIELLVVIIIIGILSAVALPNLLSQTSKARQSEAKTNVGALLRGQQAVRLERGSFTTNTDALDVSVEGTFYTYEAAQVGSADTRLAVKIDAKEATNVDGVDYTDDLLDYTGGAFQPNDGDFGSIICEADVAAGTVSGLGGTTLSDDCNASSTALN